MAHQGQARDSNNWRTAHSNSSVEDVEARTRDVHVAALKPTLPAKKSSLPSSASLVLLAVVSAVVAFVLDELYPEECPVESARRLPLLL